MYDAFWDAVDEYLHRVPMLSTVSELIELTADHFAAEMPFAAGDALFPGDAGEVQLYWVLNDRWQRMPIVGDQVFIARDTFGGVCTYIDGDLYQGNRTARACSWIRKSSAAGSCHHAANSVRARLRRRRHPTQVVTRIVVQTPSPAKVGPRYVKNVTPAPQSLPE